jgi:hypothetical protein
VHVLQRWREPCSSDRHITLMIHAWAGGDVVQCSHVRLDAAVRAASVEPTYELACQRSSGGLCLHLTVHGMCFKRLAAVIGIDVIFDTFVTCPAPAYARCWRSCFFVFHFFTFPNFNGAKSISLFGVTRSAGLCTTPALLLLLQHHSQARTPPGDPWTIISAASL